MPDLSRPFVHSVRLVWEHDPHGEPYYLKRSAEDHFGVDGSAWSTLWKFIALELPKETPRHFVLFSELVRIQAEWNESSSVKNLRGGNAPCN